MAVTKSHCTLFYLFLYFISKLASLQSFNVTWHLSVMSKAVTYKVHFWYAVTSAEYSGQVHILKSLGSGQHHGSKSVHGFK